jgi:hypothetical protein
MIYSTKNDFNSENIKILSVDFETRQLTEGDNNDSTRTLFAAGFCSNTGLKEAIHLEDSKFNNDEVKFIRYIVYKIQSFQGIITGWYITNSDLVILDEVCKRIGVLSPVEFYEVSVTSPMEQVDTEEEENDNNDDNESLENTTVKSYPYLKNKKMIDMYKVFHHNFIKNSVYPFKYRDLQLDTVATGMLEGYGKYVNESTGIKITGENVLQFSIEEQNIVLVARLILQHPFLYL